MRCDKAKVKTNSHGVCAVYPDKMRINKCKKNKRQLKSVHVRVVFARICRRFDYKCCSHHRVALSVTRHRATINDQFLFIEEEKNTTKIRIISIKINLLSAPLPTTVHLSRLAEMKNRNWVSRFFKYAHLLQREEEEVEKKTCCRIRCMRNLGIEKVLK